MYRTISSRSIRSFCLRRSQGLPLLPARVHGPRTRNYRTSNSVSVDHPIYSLTLSENKKLRDWELERFKVFDDEQAKAICRFLRFMVEQDDFIDVVEARKASKDIGPSFARPSDQRWLNHPAFNAVSSPATNATESKAPRADLGFAAESTPAAVPDLRVGPVVKQLLPLNPNSTLFPDGRGPRLDEPSLPIRAALRIRPGKDARGHVIIVAAPRSGS